MITLKATLVTATDDLRGELERPTDFQLVTSCAALPSNSDLTDPGDAMRHVLAALARRWLELHEEIKIHSRQLKTLTERAAPDLVEAFGIGPDIAGELLVAAGDNSDRSAPTPPSPSCAAPVPSPPARARRTDATASTGVGTGKPTPPSTVASSCACAGTPQPSPTSNGAPPKDCPSRRSSAASSATSPVRSSPCSRQRPRRHSNHTRSDLTIYRSIIALMFVCSSPRAPRWLSSRSRPPVSNCASWQPASRCRARSGG